MPKSTPPQPERPASLRRRVGPELQRQLNGADPIIRVGLMEEYDRINFALKGAYDLLSLAGDSLQSNLSGGGVWTVRPDETIEARAVFSILTTAFASKDSAEQLRRELAQNNQPARIAEVGAQVFLDGRLVADNIKYRVLVGRWPTQREAIRHMEPFKDDFAPRPVRQIIRPATGTIELRAEDGSRRFKLEDGFRLVPRKDTCSVRLFDVREGTGFIWEREVDRDYPGVIEIRIDHRGLLMALIEVPLELYLKGVVPSEMSAAYPFEALKAQAVAARSEVLAKMGVKHPNDPFDLCAHVHCQAYTGITHYDPRAAKAVDSTRGFVLTLNGLVAEAVYSACCGGHTEDKVNVWNPPEASHLKGGWDFDSKGTKSSDAAEFTRLDLSTESGAERWINSSPPAWCNVAYQAAQQESPLPLVLQKASDVFRWEITYTRRELEDIIKRKSGEDIGTLVNIVPLQRGVSGRLMEIEIQGTQRNLRIQRELNIRNVLSPQYLRSACFTIEVGTAPDGEPLHFRLRGAGYGHGVGMCQVGAAMMAQKGRKFKEILSHYYPGTTVERIYGGG